MSRAARASIAARYVKMPLAISSDEEESDASVGPKSNSRPKTKTRARARRRPGSSSGSGSSSDVVIASMTTTTTTKGPTKRKAPETASSSSSSRARSPSSRSDSSASKYKTGEEEEVDENDDVVEENPEAGLMSVAGPSGTSNGDVMGADKNKGENGERVNPGDKGNGDRGEEGGREASNQPADEAAVKKDKGKGRAKSSEKDNVRRTKRGKKKARHASPGQESSSDEEDPYGGRSRGERARSRRNDTTGTKSKNGRGKRRLALSSDSSSSSSSSAESSSSTLARPRRASSASSDSSATFFGRLHGSDSEPEMGSWTHKDQKQIAITREGPEERDEDGNPIHEVSGILRWRRHPRRMYPQYRAVWKGWGLWDNTWEHGDCFNIAEESRSDPTDVINRFWTDLESEGLPKRPDDWDEMEEHSLHSSDTCEMLRSEDPKTYKEGWKRTRRDLRRDKKAQRQMNRRKEQWRLKEEKEKEDAKEALRQKRRKEREYKDQLAAKATTSSSVPTKTTISISSKPMNGSKSAVASQAQASSSSSAAANAVRRPAQSVGSSTGGSKSQHMQAPSTASNPSLEDAAQFLSAPKTARRGGGAGAAAGRGGRGGRGAYVGQHRQPPKVKVFDPLSSFPVPSSSASKISASEAAAAPATNQTSAASTVSTDTSVKEKELRPLRETKWTETSKSTSAASAPGGWSRNAGPLPAPLTSFSSHHNYKYGDPRGHISPTSTSSAPKEASYRHRVQSPPSAGNESGTWMQPNQVLRMGVDPRRGAQTSAVFPPKREPSITSPPPQSPSLQSPRRQDAIPQSAPSIDGMRESSHESKAPAAGINKDGTEPSTETVKSASSLGATLNELRDNDKKEAEEAIREWSVTEDMINIFRPRYNVVHKDEKTLLKVLLYCEATFKLEIEPKLFEPSKNVIYWVRDLGMALSTKEREALQRPNFIFWTYGTEGIKEVWPQHSGGILMYTFGALLHRLVDQCYHKRDRPDEAGRVMLHPVQKLLVQQLCKAERGPSALIDLLEALELVNPTQSASAALELVETSCYAVDVIEEVDLQDIDCPISIPVDLDGELQEIGNSSPSVGATVGSAAKEKLLQMVKEVDTETLRALRKLQVHLAAKKRTFTLIMEATQLTEAEAGTCTRVIKPRQR